MRAWGDLNPNAIRVIRRILVLVDSIKPLDRLCSIAARIRVVDAIDRKILALSSSRAG